MAISQAMRELGIAGLWEQLNDDAEAAELLTAAVVLKSGKALGSVSRQWRKLGGSVSIPDAVAAEAADQRIPAWYGMLGRACTRLGLLPHLGLAGYRRVFEPR